MVTNMWPNEHKPAYGIFVKRQIESLRRLGLECDVLFVEGYRTRWDYARAALYMLALNFSRRRPRLVHGHGGETALVVRWYVRGAVLVSYCGDDLLGTPRADASLTRSSRARRFVLRRQAALMTATITKSREMENALPRLVRRRNLVVPNGVDRSLFRPQPRAQAREQLGWPQDARIALFAADPAVERKRFWLAQAACRMAEADLGPIRLEVAWGTPPAAMPRLMAAADCLLLTSAIEGSPNVIKEAVCCGLPVISTDVGDVRELLDGVSPSWVCAAEPAALSTALVQYLAALARSNGWEAGAWLDESQIGARLLRYYDQYAAGITPPAAAAA
jgi:glycosyltransferase involved in cell wall biosynthesis